MGGSGQGGQNAGNIFKYQSSDNTDPNMGPTSKDNYGSNYYNLKPQYFDYANAAIHNALNYDPAQAAQDINSNSLTSGLQGQINSTNSQINNLQNSGFALQPQDYQMYGQQAGQITRNMGAQTNNLAQALAARGLSNSGVAGAQFTTAAGSQNEQLANQMMAIQQNRYQQNMQSLQNARNYATQLNSQINQDMGQNENQALARGNAGANYLSNYQNQENNALAQYAQTNKPSGTGQLIGTIGGGIAGAFAGNPMLGASLGGAIGGAADGSGGGGLSPSAFNGFSLGGGSKPAGSTNLYAGSDVPNVNLAKV